MDQGQSLLSRNRQPEGGGKQVSAQVQVRVMSAGVMGAHGGEWVTLLGRATSFSSAAFLLYVHLQAEPRGPTVE